MMSPADFFGLEVPDFHFRRDSGMNIIVPGPHRFVLRQRLRRQRRGLGGRKRGGPGGNSNAKFQKMTALHGHLPVGKCEVTPAEFECAEMNGR